MNTDDLVRLGRPDSAGWAVSDAGQRVLDRVVTAAAADDLPPRTVVGRSRASRPVLRWSFLGTGLVGATAAAVLAVSAIPAPQGAQLETPPLAGGESGAGDNAVGGVTPTTARGILLAAASRAEQAPAETGRYWHLRTFDVYGPQRVGAGADWYWVLRRSVNERWQASDPGEGGWIGRRELGARPYSAADEHAWRSAGSPTEWFLDADSPDPQARAVVSTQPGEGTLRQDTQPTRFLNVEHIGQLTLDEVRQLPDEPDALRAWVIGRIQTKTVGTDSSWSSSLLFSFLTELLLDAPAPPKVRAAAFRILADLPGAHTLGIVKDEAGRPGFGVEFRRNGATTRLIVDGSTLRLLGIKTASDDMKQSSYPGKEHSTVVLTAEWSDAAPQPPSLPEDYPALMAPIR